MTIIPGVNDQATLMARYTAASLAYHDLALGQQLVEGRHSIEMMSFNRTNMAQLAAYIAQLANQLAVFGIQLPGARIRAKNILHESGRIRRRVW